MSPVFTCSIDDGHPLDIKTAELLNKHGLRATFYIPIRNCEGDSVIELAQLRELAAEFEIGSHTYDHRYLKSIDVRQSYNQIFNGKKRLEEMIGIPVHGFCYPGGRYRPRDVELVKACDFSYARTTMNLRFDEGKSRFEIPTTIQFYPHARAVYLRNFVAAGQWHERAEGLRLALTHENWINRLYAMFDHACERGGVFHLWGHTKQIEQLNAWADLECFFRHVAARIPHAQRLTNAQLAGRLQAAPDVEAIQQSA